MAWKQQTGIEPPASAVKQWSYEEVKGKYGSQAKEDEIAPELMNEMRNQQYQAQSHEIQGQIQEEQIKQQDAAMRAQNRANLIQLGSSGYQVYDFGKGRGWWGSGGTQANTATPAITSSSGGTTASGITLGSTGAGPAFTGIPAVTSSLGSTTAGTTAATYAPATITSLSQQITCRVRWLLHWSLLAVFATCFILVCE